MLIVKHTYSLHEQFLSQVYTQLALYALADSLFTSTWGGGIGAFHVEVISTSNEICYNCYMFRKSLLISIDVK